VLEGFPSPLFFSCPLLRFPLLLRGGTLCPLEARADLLLLNIYKPSPFPFFAWLLFVPPARLGSLQPFPPPPPWFWLSKHHPPCMQSFTYGFSTFFLLFASFSPFPFSSCTLGLYSQNYCVVRQYLRQVSGCAARLIRLFRRPLFALRRPWSGHGVLSGGRARRRIERAASLRHFFDPSPLFPPSYPGTSTDHTVSSRSPLVRTMFFEKPST